MRKKRREGREHDQQLILLLLSLKQIKQTTSSRKMIKYFVEQLNNVYVRESWWANDTPHLWGKEGLL